MQESYEKIHENFHYLSFLKTLKRSKQLTPEKETLALKQCCLQDKQEERSVSIWSKERKEEKKKKKT